MPGNRGVSEDVGGLSEESLAALVERHDRLYWEEGAPEISDDEYDAIVRKLAAVNPKHPVLSKIHSPAAAALGKVRHAKPMLSLDKAYSFDEVFEWALKHARSENEELVLQPKYDGVSANYSNGVLATRGDGFVGEDISDKIPLVELEAKDYEGPLICDSRGEIVIRNDDFKNIYSKIRKKNGELYKNPRNAVSGILGLKEIGDMVHQGAKLTLVDYGVVSFRVKLRDLKEKWPEIVEFIESLPYPMDGIVVKLADDSYRESLGSTAHHPRGEIAFKFSGVRRETELLDVEWSFGKNCLTPVAILLPVEISGATIRRASLHNVQNIIDNDIMIGDTVTVERAGDVIPHIVASKPGAERRSCLISNCPSCGAELERSGPELRCPNPECPETRLARLMGAIRSLGIDGLGEPNVRRMMETLGVRTLRDVLDLTLDDILKLEGFKEKSASNLLASIGKAKRVPEHKLLAAMNIKGVGANIAKKILEGRALGELRGMSSEDLAAIDGVGPERAEAISSTLREDAELLDELLDAVEVVREGEGGGVRCPTICFTGKMPEKRSYYEDLARRRGFEPVDSVTSSLSLLVAADPNAVGGKLAKAAKFGTEVVPLDDWLAGGVGAISAEESEGAATADDTGIEQGVLPGFE